MEAEVFPMFQGMKEVGVEAEACPAIPGTKEEEVEVVGQGLEGRKAMNVEDIKV